MAKYTQGKWGVLYGEVVRIGDNAPIASMDRTDKATKAGITPTEMTANARLIACAPEMLETFQAIFDSLTDDYQIEVAELINKAGGW